MLTIGLALIPDIINTIYTLIYLLQPSPSAFWGLHLIAVLMFNIIMLGLYLSAAFFNALHTYSNESGCYLEDQWQSVGYADVGVQSVLGLCYVGMVGWGGVAVHWWRVGRKEGKIKGDCMEKGGRRSEENWDSEDV
jgi:hypothetical protein